MLRNTLHLNTSPELYFWSGLGFALRKCCCICCSTCFGRLFVWDANLSILQETTTSFSLLSFNFATYMPRYKTLLLTGNASIAGFTHRDSDSRERSYIIKNIRDLTSATCVQSHWYANISKHLLGHSSSRKPIKNQQL